MRARLRRRRDERGASAVEYGLLVAAMAAVIVGVVFGLGKLVDSAFEKTCVALNSEVKPGCQMDAGQTGDGNGAATVQGDPNTGTDTGTDTTPDTGADTGQVAPQGG